MARKQREFSPGQVWTAALVIAVALLLMFTLSPYIRTIAGSATMALILMAAMLLSWLIHRLNVSEARVRAIVESAADGIIAADEDGHIESFNAAALRIFGMRSGEMMGSSITSLLSFQHAEGADDDLDAFFRAEELDEASITEEVIGLRRDGSRFFMDLTASRAMIGSRWIYTVIVRDATERKRAQSDLIRAHNELEHRVAERTSELSAINKLLNAEIDSRKRAQEALKRSHDGLEHRVAERTSHLKRAVELLETEIHEREQAQEALLQARDELEVRVQERTAELSRANLELQEALENVKTLHGMLPICASCKKIRDDNGYWNQIEDYVGARSDAEFSHGICPECARRLYPEIYDGEDT